jgi:hypothetical protein
MSPGEPVRDNYRNQGRLEERERIISLAQNQICFDHVEPKGCEHSSCYALCDLIKLIKGEK